MFLGMALLETLFNVTLLAVVVFIAAGLLHSGGERRLWTALVSLVKCSIVGALGAALLALTLPAFAVLQAVAVAVGLLCAAWLIAETFLHTVELVADRLWPPRVAAHELLAGDRNPR